MFDLSGMFTEFQTRYIGCEPRMKWYRLLWVWNGSRCCLRRLIGGTRLIKQPKNILQFLISFLNNVFSHSVAAKICTAPASSYKAKMFFLHLWTLQIGQSFFKYSLDGIHHLLSIFLNVICSPVAQARALTSSHLMYWTKPSLWGFVCFIYPFKTSNSSKRVLPNFPTPACFKHCL